MRYDLEYREAVVLEDGTGAELRLIRPEDKALVARGFLALSPQTRYLRFFAHKQHLTSADLRYLTELDLEHHLALGAVGVGADRIPLPMGIARFIRERDPAVAEGAVVVVDAFQGQGLGAILLARLGAAAHERGIRALRFTALCENRALPHLVHRVFREVRAGPVEEGTRTFLATCAPLDRAASRAPPPRAPAPPGRRALRM
jgi:GNAT superfamily N-acetyltransferase